MLSLFIFFWRKLFNAILEIIFPDFCVGCNKINTLLCNRCYETLEFTQHEFINPSQKSLNSIVCCCYYNGIAKKIIHELKYKSVVAVGKIIAHLMFYHSNIPNFDVLTFVPIHKKKLDQRGFNQSQVIALELAKLTKKPIVELLIKTKHTQSQMSLELKTNRENNIEGTINTNPEIPFSFTFKNPTVLIVDDVFTSGTTLNYCAKILKNFGFKTVHGICFLFKS